MHTRPVLETVNFYFDRFSSSAGIAGVSVSINFHEPAPTAKILQKTCAINGMSE
jgi:hypothetical protein